jgi:hypothetical protein
MHRASGDCQLPMFRACRVMFLITTSGILVPFTVPADLASTALLNRLWYNCRRVLFLHIATVRLHAKACIELVHMFHLIAPSSGASVD